MYVPSSRQRKDMQRSMSQDGLLATPSPNPVAPNGEVALLVDSPNAYKSAKQVFGSTARPNYAEIQRLAASYGTLTRCEFFVNPGYAQPGKWLTGVGYNVVRGTDRDVDYLIVDRAVEAIVMGASVLILVTGDKRFAKVATICALLNIVCVTIAVPACANRKLVEQTVFYPLPIVHLSPVAA